MSWVVKASPVMQQLQEMLPDPPEEFKEGDRIEFTDRYRIRPSDTIYVEEYELQRNDDPNDIDEDDDNYDGYKRDLWNDQSWTIASGEQFVIGSMGHTHAVLQDDDGIDRYYLRMFDLNHELILPIKKI